MADMPTWTVWDLQAAYELGYETCYRRMTFALADVREADVLAAQRTREERVAERVALFERCATEGHARRGTREWTGVGA